MPGKRVRTLVRAPLSPTIEVPALSVNSIDTSEQPPQDDQYIYDSDDDLTLERNQTPNTSSSSTSAGITAPIGSANSVIELKDQSIEEVHLMAYLMLVKHNYLGSALTPAQDDVLARILYKMLPQNSGMLKQFTEQITSEVGKGLDTVLNAVYRIKSVLAMVRQAIRIATSYGPDSFVYRIDSRDKEITNSSHSS